MSHLFLQRDLKILFYRNPIQLVPLLMFVQIQKNILVLF